MATVYVDKGLISGESFAYLCTRCKSILIIDENLEPREISKLQICCNKPFTFRMQVEEIPIEEEENGNAFKVSDSEQAGQPVPANG
jgi:hypothetical protein